VVHIFGSAMGIFIGAEGTTHSFSPLIFDPGEAYQVYWSHEIVAIDNATTTVNMAHERPLYDYPTRSAH